MADLPSDLRVIHVNENPRLSKNSIHVGVFCYKIGLITIHYIYLCDILFHLSMPCEVQLHI